VEPPGDGESRSKKRPSRARAQKDEKAVLLHRVTAEGIDDSISLERHSNAYIQASQPASQPIAMRTSSAFKVIIVGGGPVGLTAAHALSVAGIDFVVLEGRDDPFQDSGASLVLNPGSLRVMQQLGLLPSLQAIGAEMVYIKSYDVQGNLFENHEGFRLVREK
jgi:hypothetical protein